MVRSWPGLWLGARNDQRQQSRISKYIYELLAVLHYVNASLEHNVTMKLPGEIALWPFCIFVFVSCGFLFGCQFLARQTRTLRRPMQNRHLRSKPRLDVVGRELSKLLCNLPQGLDLRISGCCPRNTHTDVQITGELF